MPRRLVLSICAVSGGTGSLASPVVIPQTCFSSSVNALPVALTASGAPLELVGQLSPLADASQYVTLFLTDSCPVLIAHVDTCVGNFACTKTVDRHAIAIETTRRDDLFPRGYASSLRRTAHSCTPPETDSTYSTAPAWFELYDSVSRVLHDAPLNWHRNESESDEPPECMLTKLVTRFVMPLSSKNERQADQCADALTGVRYRHQATARIREPPVAPSSIVFRIRHDPRSSLQNHTRYRLRLQCPSQLKQTSSIGMARATVKMLRGVRERRVQMLASSPQITGDDLESNLESAIEESIQDIPPGTWIAVAVFAFLGMVTSATRMTSFLRNNPLVYRMLRLLHTFAQFFYVCAAVWPFIGHWLTPYFTAMLTLELVDGTQHKVFRVILYSISVCGVIQRLFIAYAIRTMGKDVRVTTAKEVTKQQPGTHLGNNNNLYFGPLVAARLRVLSEKAESRGQLRKAVVTAIQNTYDAVISTVSAGVATIKNTAMVVTVTSVLVPVLGTPIGVISGPTMLTAAFGQASLKLLATKCLARLLSLGMTDVISLQPDTANTKTPFLFFALIKTCFKVIYTCAVLTLHLFLFDTPGNLSTGNAFLANLLLWIPAFVCGFFLPRQIQFLRTYEKEPTNKNTSARHSPISYRLEL